MKNETEDKPINFNERCSQLSQAQKELLDKCLSGIAVQDFAKPIISPYHLKSSNVPLSYAQQRLWMLMQLNRYSSAYNVPIALLLRGKLDNIALEKSINEIVERHEVLRTTFDASEGRPQQILHSELFVPLQIKDIQAYTTSKLDIGNLQLVSDEIRTPFDLANGPLLRVVLLRISENEQLLLLNFHHIVFDGWSEEVFFKELNELYEAHVRGKPNCLPELPIQYADYSIWQREWLQGEDLEEQLSYWKKQLKGIPSLLELPTDRPRPVDQLYEGAMSTFILPEELSRKIKQISRAEEATLFMVLLTAFQVLLYRYSGQNDVVVGLPIANRINKETEGLIGFFVNSLVIRTHINDDLSFRELLKLVQKTTLGVFAHQDLPFERLIEELKPERSLNHNPVFNVMFDFRNTSKDELRLADLKIERIAIHNETTKFDLTLSINDRGDSLNGTIEYSTALFDKSTIIRMTEHYQTLLESAIANHNLQISDLSILTEKERHQILVEWNDTRIDFPEERCIHELFEAQVEKTPEAIALVFEEQHLSYRELNKRSNQMGQSLQKLGIGPDDIVGIYVERSIDMIVGILGILKAGGSYLPLDPSYPEERLALVLKDSRISVILTHSYMRSKLPASKFHEICINSFWEVITKESGQNFRSGVTVNNLAYLIYTSGSTGIPKGVLVEHHSVVNHNQAIIQKFRLTTKDRILQFSTIAFDIAVEEIFPTIMCGATLVIRAGFDLLEVNKLIKYIDTKSITVLDLPTAYWQTLTRELATTCQPLPKSLRLVIIGGEEVNVKDFLTWENLYGTNVDLLNSYGPTETTVIGTLYEAPNRRSASLKLDTVPIGKPIPNVQIYITDNNLHSVPIGVTGELCIGGKGIARGYFARPDLTVERFVPDPFSREPGSRMYRTGDLACYLPNGDIKFLGRIDHQVKLRGYRIELAEVEKVLGQFPGVENVLTMVHTNEAGDKQLVAYIVLGERQTLNMTELRYFLRESLPEYMVPSAFVKLDSIPLMPNGKVDRKALLEVEREGYHEGREFITPQTPTQVVLTEIFSELLGVKSIGIHDNFFELGGHSLLAIQIAARVRKVFRVEITLSTIFRDSTIIALAILIDEQRTKSDTLNLTISPIYRDQKIITISSTGEIEMKDS